MLVACLESLVQKVQFGVVINFEKIGPDPPAIGNEGINYNEYCTMSVDIINEFLKY